MGGNGRGKVCSWCARVRTNSVRYRVESRREWQVLEAMGLRDMPETVGQRALRQCTDLKISAR